MAELKDLDKRYVTQGGATIRVETWIDLRTKNVVRYNLSYVNRKIYAGDNGRIIGFDNAHHYAEFESDHHYHRFGQVFESASVQSFEEAISRFDAVLRRLKRCYGKEY